MFDAMDPENESRFEFGPQDYVPMIAVRFANESPLTAVRLDAHAARRLLYGPLASPPMPRHTSPTTPGSARDK